jgi:hypothetical protein
MKVVNIVEKLSDVINEKEEAFVRLKNSHNTDTEAMNDYRKLDSKMVNLIEELKNKAIRYEKIADYAKEADTK